MVKACTGTLRTQPMRLATCVFLVFLSLLTVGIQLQAEALIHSEGPVFRDAEGRLVILRGVNVAGNAKVPPFRPLANPDVLLPLQELGFNTLRLLFNWEAFEPERGVYDESYLNYYENVVRWAGEHGFYVIVDIHQDAFSRYSVSGCGEGFPKWALPPEVTAATPNNGYACRNWALWMIIDPGMHASWRHFYANTYKVRDHYLSMLGKIAERLADYPQVIGYDPLNEPWGDELREVYPLYADAAQRIRTHHPSAMMFLCPHVLVGSGSATALPRPSFGNAVYAPHYYDASVVGIHRWLGFSFERPLKGMLATAKAWNAPMLVGEFGSPATAVRAREFMEHSYNVLDEYLSSSTQWVFTPAWNPQDLDGWNGEDLSITDDQGRLRSNFRARPYWQKVAGKPLGVTHRRTGSQRRTISFRWRHDPALGASVFYLPPAHLRTAGALKFKVHPAGVACQLTASSHLMHCTHNAPAKVKLKISY